MAHILVTATFEGATTTPTDHYVNTFAFKDLTDASDATTLSLMQKVEAFYNTLAPTAVARVGAYISADVRRAAGVSKLRSYDITGHLDGSPHGTPTNELPFTLVASSSVTCMPHEVALGLTLEGLQRNFQPVEIPDGVDPGSQRDRPMQRRTGRIFIGPLNINTLDGAAGRPEAVFMSDVRKAADKLHQDVQSMVSGADDGWSVWSRADAELYAVESVFTDNAFDTQRRRGLAPTSKTRLTL